MTKITSNTIDNCHQTKLTLGRIYTEQEESRHLYLIESLSRLTVFGGNQTMSMQPYDILLGRDFENYIVESLTGDPLLLRIFSVTFDLPRPLSEYTVGDNALIYDVMNDDSGEHVHVLFTNLQARVCHAYLDAVESLMGLDIQDDSYIDFQCQKVIGLLFTELLREHDQKVSKSVSAFPTTEVKHASKDTQSGMIMRYLTREIDQVTLKQAAEHFSYQTNYFSRLCKELFGVSFHELKNHIRLELAKEQLRLTTKSMEMISQELGYKAVSNFYRNFKKETGLTPKESA